MQMGSLPPLHLLRLCVPVPVDGKKRPWWDDWDDESPTGPEEVFPFRHIPPSNITYADRLRFGIYQPNDNPEAIEAVNVSDDESCAAYPYGFKFKDAKDLPSVARVIETLETLEQGEQLLSCAFAPEMLYGIRPPETRLKDDFVCAFDRGRGHTTTEWYTDPKLPPKLVGMITIEVSMTHDEWSKAATELLGLTDTNSFEILVEKAKQTPGVVDCGEAQRGANGVLKQDQFMHCLQRLNKMRFKLKYACTSNARVDRSDKQNYIPDILRGMVRAVERMIVEYWVTPAFDFWLTEVEKRAEEDPKYEAPEPNFDTFLSLAVMHLELELEPSVWPSFEGVGFTKAADFEISNHMFKSGLDFHDFQHPQC